MFWDGISAAWARPDSQFSYPCVIPSNIHSTRSQECIFITYSYLYSGSCSSYSGDNVWQRQHDLLWQFSPIVLSYNANIPKEKTKGKRDLKNTPDLTDPPQAFSVSVYYVSCLLHKSIAHFNLLGLLWAPLCAFLTMSPYRHTMRVSLSLAWGEKSNLESWTQSDRILFREKYLPLCRIFFHYFGRVSWPCLKLYNACSLFLQWLCSISIIKICYHGALL